MHNRCQVNTIRVKLLHNSNIELLMKTTNKILIYLIIFAIIDVLIPIPITALLLIYVLREKPEWFKNLVTRIYSA